MITFFSGRQYDGDGILKQWWSNTSVKNFKERADCISKQYSSYTVEDANKKVPLLTHSEDVSVYVDVDRSSRWNGVMFCVVCCVWLIYIYRLKVKVALRYVILFIVLISLFNLLTLVMWLVLVKCNHQEWLWNSDYNISWRSGLE